MAPKIFNVHISTFAQRNPIATLGLLVNIGITASSDAIDVRFSNNGVTFSSYETLANTKYSFDLSTLGGSTTQELKTVYVQVRNGSLQESSVATARIFLGEAPFVDFVSVTQRSDDTFIDAVINVFSDYSLSLDIPLFEYSLTGAFTGEELPATMVTDMSSLAATRAGIQHVVTWDALGDLGSGIYSATAKLRARAEFLNDFGTITKSSAFSVDTRTQPENGGKSVTRGTSTVLNATMRDENNALFNPTLVEIISIKDPSDTEYLVVPAIVSPTGTGIFNYTYSVLAAYPLGQWRYTYRSTVGTIVKIHELFFTVVQAVPLVNAPSAPSVCLIDGVITGPDGQPIATTYGPSGEPQAVVVEFYNAGRRGTGAIVTATSKTVATCDANGKFKVELLKNAEFIVSIPIVNFRKTLKIPNAPAANFEDLEEVVLPVKAHGSFGETV